MDERNRGMRQRTPYLIRQSHVSDTAHGMMRRRELGNSIVDSAVGFPYYRRLRGHSSCVNALSFSRGDGKLLASGGDDFSILLWDFHQDDVKAPSHSMNSPTGNIFCLEFSASNNFLFVGGTDSIVYKYDIEHFSSVIAPKTIQHCSTTRFVDHDDTIRAISSHPIHDEIFLSASEDGSILCHDTRQPTSMSHKSSSLQLNVELSGVQYHPSMDNLFASSNSKGQVFLHDARMAFESDDNEATRGQKGIVQKYTHVIEKSNPSRMSNPEASSLAFDKDGSKLAVTFLNYCPVIYSVSDPNPIAVLSGKNLPDGTLAPPNQRTYSNSCTMKHGSFGGASITTGEMYAGGSDDFRNYIWKIPPVQWLLDRREQFSAEKWENEADPNAIGFSQGFSQDKYVPYEISTPFCRLTGYNSIVNTSVFHPHLLHIASSGVEKDVFIHSPTPSSPCTQNLQCAPTQVRQILDEEVDRDRENYIAALLAESPLYESEAGHASDDEERRALSLFDFIIREEGDTDVFASRRWTELHESCSSNEDIAMESDDDEGDGGDILSNMTWL